MTTPTKPFDNGPRFTVAKDAAIVALTALIVAGFLASVWKPQPPKSVQPAVYVAVR